VFTELFLLRFAQVEPKLDFIHRNPISHSLSRTLFFFFSILLDCRFLSTTFPYSPMRRTTRASPFSSSSISSSRFEETSNGGGSSRRRSSRLLRQGSPESNRGGRTCTSQRHYRRFLLLCTSTSSSLILLSASRSRDLWSSDKEDARQISFG